MDITLVLYWKWIRMCKIQKGRNKDLEVQFSLQEGTWIGRLITYASVNVELSMLAHLQANFCFGSNHVEPHSWQQIYRASQTQTIEQTEHFHVALIHSYCILWPAVCWKLLVCIMSFRQHALSIQWIDNPWWNADEILATRCQGPSRNVPR
jgi:hypothetical protein